VSRARVEVKLGHAALAANAHIAGSDAVVRLMKPAAIVAGDALTVRLAW